MQLDGIEDLLNEICCRSLRVEKVIVVKRSGNT